MEGFHLKQRIAVLGATGYVGSRLVPTLLDAGYQVRACARSLEKLKQRAWATHPNVELIAVDVLDEVLLEESLEDCHAVFYAIHTFASPQGAIIERQAASNMIRAAELAEVKRVIYLGVLSKHTHEVSRLIQSCREVAAILQSGMVPVTIFRTSMIIGSGSTPFEVFRYLADKYVILPAPLWINSLCQPIAIRNVLDYLRLSLETPETIGQSYDIGGPDILTYRELMELYANESGLRKRWVIPVAWLPNRLSIQLIRWALPMPSALAAVFVENRRESLICQNNHITEVIPTPLLSCREAIRLALDSIIRQNLQGEWADLGGIPPVEARHPGDPVWSGGTVYRDSRVRRVPVPPRSLWGTIVSDSGQSGWYYGTWLLKVKRFLNGLFARDEARFLNDEQRVWRVLSMEEAKQICLLAEIRLPGQTVLEFQLIPAKGNQVDLIQTTWFAPRGLAGVIGWNLIKPFHSLIFNSMLRNVASAAVKPRKF